MTKHETMREEIQALTKAYLKKGGKIDKVKGSERNATFKTRLVKTHKASPAYKNKSDSTYGSSFTINAKKRDTKKTL
tara:strand:- start:536 stop:766 length:231 start_codon:yes stop_codon:yes gene_type:complete